VSLLEKNEVSSFFVKSFGGKPYAEIQALHYLCRPNKLEMLSAKHFFEQYEVKKSNVRNRVEELMPLSDTQYYLHPSTTFRKDGEASLFVRLRNKSKLSSVNQRLFVDTANFSNNILTCSEDLITIEMESYACRTLALCHHYR
jgi:hypothetical protein